MGIVLVMMVILDVDNAASYSEMICWMKTF